MAVGRHKSDRSRLYHALDAVQNLHLAVWTLAATLSILTSRYLFVELNIHYPIHLHLLQLATAGAIAFAAYTSQSQTSPLLGKQHWQQWLPIAITAALMATATVFSLQAVLHSQNLPTLPMLAVIIPGVQACIQLVLAQGQRSRWDIVSVVIIAIGCAGILLGEYRLLVPVLESAIPALLIAGIARAYHSITIQNTGVAHDLQRARLLFCSTGFLVTGIWAMTRQDESWRLFFHALRFKDVPLLVVNCLATAVAMLLGRSFLFPLGNSTDLANETQADNNMGEVLAFVAMTGTVGLWSTLILRRSYTSWTQLWFFFLAVAFIVSKIRLDSTRDRRKIYSVAPSGSTSHYVDSEDNDVVELSESQDRNGHQKNFFRRVFGLASVVVVPSIWLAFLVMNFSQRVHHNVVANTPALDLDYAPTTGIEMVISMYKERVDEVARLISTIKTMPSLREASVHIYVKDNGTDLDWIRMGTGANNVTLIPNIGREGETYLYHILHNWNSLAKHTMFLQADVHNPREFYPRIRDYFDPVRTGMLNLGWSGQVCNCDSCGDRHGFEDTTHLFPDLHSRISNTTACDKVLLSYKGQFIASAKRIRGIDKSIYADIHDAMANPDSWAHQEAYLQGRKDSMSAPVFGYTVERIWNLLMQCNDMEVAWKCASLVSGKRTGGSMQDCQCFDPVSASATLE